MTRENTGRENEAPAKLFSAEKSFHSVCFLVLVDVQLLAEKAPQERRSPVIERLNSLDQLAADSTNQSAHFQYAKRTEHTRYGKAACDYNCIDIGWL